MKPINKEAFVPDWLRSFEGELKTCKTPEEKARTSKRHWQMYRDVFGDIIDPEIEAAIREMEARIELAP